MTTHKNHKGKKSIGVKRGKMPMKEGEHMMESHSSPPSESMKKWKMKGTKHTKM